MPAGAHVELEPMPRADDVERTGAVVDAEAAAVGVEPLLGALHQLSLADRSALVRAVVAPGVERAVDAKDSDLDLVVDDDLALAVGDFVLARDKDFPHESIVSEAPAPRQNAAAAPARIAARDASCTIARRRQAAWPAWPGITTGYETKAATRAPQRCTIRCKRGHRSATQGRTPCFDG